MNIAEIQSRIVELKKRYKDIEPRTLRETLEVVYSNLVLTRLEQIFNYASPGSLEEITSDLTNTLTLFLEENWTLINSTLLSYTALPNSEVTDLLITIAASLAQDKKQVSAIQLLMPTVSLDSLKPDSYASLDQIVAPLEIKAILQSHILGYKGLYLLPIKLLTELNLDVKSSPLLYNPYFDCFLPHPDEAVTVNTEEFARLVGHDSLTQALFDQKQAYENLTTDTSSLLGQLKQLIKNLEIHSASGIGEETNASGGAYPAIISFMHYYAQLEPCGLQVSENIPTLESLLEEQMMGYVLVRPTPEETALYFINRYDDSTPVKKVTTNQQYLRYSLDLVTVDNRSDIELLEPRLSTLHPTLFKIKGEPNSYILYGYADNNEWELTPLDAEPINAAKISFPDQKPNEDKRIIHLPLGRIPQTIYDNITTHKAHNTQPLASYLYQLSNSETEHLYAPIRVCSLQQLEEIKHLTNHNFFDEQNRIPRPLQSEINQLFELVQDSTQNINATENLQTCIATRRENLVKKMTGLDSTLVTITLSGDTRNNHISETKNQFNLAHQKLTEGIQADKTNTLDGYDHLGMSLELLKKLGVTLNINSLEELNLFKTINPDEIQSICSDQDIKRQIIMQIKDIGDLVIFLMDMSQEKMKSFLEASQLLDHYIKDVHHIASLLKLFDIEKSKLIVDALKLQIPQLMTLEKLILLAALIDPEYFNLVLEAWNVKNWSMNSAEDLLELMPLLPDSDKEHLYLHHQNLIENISDPYTFLTLMAIIPEPYKATFYEQKKHLIERSLEYSEINLIKSLPEMYSQRCIQGMMHRIPGILTDNPSGVICERIMAILSPEQRTTVFRSIKQTFIVHFKKDWQSGYSPNDLSFLEHLTEAQCIEFLKPLEKIRFSGRIIMTPEKFGSILYRHSNEKCRIICETWKDSIITILKSENDIVLLFKNTSIENDLSAGVGATERCSVIYDIFKEKIAGILQSEDEIKQYLTPEDQLDLSHRITVYKLQSQLWFHNDRLEAFKSALMHNESNIPTAFNELFKPKYTINLFNGNKQINANLIQIIASAETGWLQKINSALSLGLTNEQLESQSAVKTALENYVAAPIDLNQAPRN